MYIVVVDPNLFGQGGWILAKFFFFVVMDRDEVEIHKHAKNETRPISRFIIWNKERHKNLMNYTCILLMISIHSHTHQWNSLIKFINLKLKNH